VCYDDFPIEATVALGCGHRFCRSCWTGYLNAAVQDGKLCIISHCPGFKCPVLVPDKTFKNLTDAAVFERHQHYLLRSYVEDNRLLRWCPAQRCNLAVRVFNSALMAVKCRCGHSFCFQCAEESHAPVSCAQLAAWNDKCKNESETAHWIIANTKKCPKCGVRIEKSQGCNHMTCRACKYEWCWVCNGDWTQHGNHTGGYYKCNRWDPKAKPNAAAAAAGSPAATAEQAKAELNRYLHYYQRFHNHDQSKRFAERQRMQTDRRMTSLHAQSGGDAAWIEFEFLAAATAQVLECRNVLKYTYVFAYYLPDGPEKTLFEFLQQQLEAATEHLSELSELPPLDKLDRQAIVNHTRITKQFAENLINGVQNGLTSVAAH